MADHMNPFFGNYVFRLNLTLRKFIKVIFAAQQDPFNVKYDSSCIMTVFM